MILKNHIPDLAEPFQECRIDQQVCLDIMCHSGNIYSSYITTDKDNQQQDGLFVDLDDRQQDSPFVQLDDMFKELPGIHLDEGVSAYSQYRGQVSGGHTVLFSCDSSEIHIEDLQGQISALNAEDPERKWQSAYQITLAEWSLRKAVSFDVTLEGLVAAFSFTYRLPTYGVFRHGAIHRNHSLVLDDRRLLPLLGIHEEQDPERFREIILDEPDKENIEAIGAGIRVNATSEGYLLSCLATKVNTGLLDLSLMFSPEGKVTGVRAEHLAREGIDMKLSKDDKTPICPKCHSEDVVGISYGYPRERTRDAARRGEIKLGGCIIRNSNPDWYCKACRHSWFDPNDPLRIKRFPELE